MKRFLFIAAICLSGLLAFSTSAVAEIDDQGSGITVMNPADLLDIDDAARIEEQEIPSASVPEPTTFGVIAIALAVGGGLMVRRKTD